MGGHVPMSLDTQHKHRFAFSRSMPSCCYLNKSLPVASAPFDFKLDKYDSSITFLNPIALVQTQVNSKVIAA